MDYTDNYKITCNRIVGRLLPYFLRGQKLYSVLCSSLSPLKSLHDDFLDWGQGVIFKVRFPFQVLALEWRIDKLLKDEFGWTSGGCKIDKYAHQQYPSFVYGADETSQLHQIYAYPIEGTSYPNYIYKRDKYALDTTNAFNITIPIIGDDIVHDKVKRSVRNLISEYTIITKYDFLFLDI